MSRAREDAVRDGANDGPTYPPMTPVDEYPLHGWDYGDSYACQRPEDPECGVYDWRCPRCLLAAQATLLHDGDSTVMWRQDADTAEVPVMLSWLISRSIYWQGR